MKSSIKQKYFVLLLLVIVIIMEMGCSKEETKNDSFISEQKKELETTESPNDEVDDVVTEDVNTEHENSQMSEDDAAQGLEFPILLDDEKLSIESFFQMDGINPDCENAEGFGIAAISLKNVSEEYLKNAEVFLTLSDGNKVKYIVSDLPAGKSVMAFATENTSVAPDVNCMDVTCEAVYQEPQAEAMQKVSVDVNRMEILVTNTGGETISKLVLYCHNSLDEEYFGGASYAYTISNLGSGETTVIQAVDCILGMADVALVEIE